MQCIFCKVKNESKSTCFGLRNTKNMASAHSNMLMMSDILHVRLNSLDIYFNVKKVETISIFRIIFTFSLLLFNHVSSFYSFLLCHNLDFTNNLK